MRHRHHLVPIHDGGTNDADNMTPPISVRLHAAFHYDRWRSLGQIADKSAWLALSGHVSEAKRLMQLEGASRGGRALLGRPRPKSQQATEKHRSKMKGRKLTAEHRAKMSVGHKGAKYRRIAPAWNKGQRLSIEQRAKLSAAHVGIPLSEEHRSNIKAALKGRKFSEEHRHKLSAATKAWHARKRENAA